MGEMGRALFYYKAVQRGVTWGEGGTLSGARSDDSADDAAARRVLSSLRSPQQMTADSFAVALKLLPKQWAKDAKTCNLGFHHSAVGIVSLGAILAEAPAPLPANGTLAHSLVAQLAKITVVAASNEYCNGGASDTFLGGRAGILFATRFLHAHGSPTLWSDFLSLSGGSVPGHPDESAAVAALASSMIQRGLSTGVAPGVLGWHDMGGGPFFGITHGTAGVLGELLFVPAIVRNVTTVGYIVSTWQHMIDAQFETGNFPTEYWPPTDDVLVQWDHGSTGISFAMHRILALQQSPGNLSSLLTEPAARASRDTYGRGLLAKGMMLCHGTGATIFSLVAAGRTTASFLTDAAQLVSFIFATPSLSLPSRWRIPSPPSVDFLPWAGSLGGMLSLSIDLLSAGGLPSARMTGYEVDL
jgi:hypothetical protein